MHGSAQNLAVILKLCFLRILFRILIVYLRDPESRYISIPNIFKYFQYYFGTVLLKCHNFIFRGLMLPE